MVQPPTVAEAARALVADAPRTAAARRLRPPRAVPGLARLTRLAAQLLGTSSAQVSLLTDVETIAGGYGPEAGRPGEQKPLGATICSLTASSRAPLAIADTRRDPRVADLPPVTSGAVGSYLGVPLTADGGAVVGAVCVFAPAARTWDERDVDVLQQVAATVAAELQLAALNDDYRTSRALLELSVTAAGIGTFDVDLVTEVLTTNDRLLELSGLTRAGFSGRPQDVYAHVHPDDVGEVVHRLREVAERGGEYTAHYRVVEADGSHRWLTARGSALPGPDGTPARLLGAVYDVTAVRQAGERVEAILDAMAVGHLALDADWRVTYANAEAERLVGRSREELLGDDFFTTCPAPLSGRHEADYRLAVSTGQPVVFDAHAGPADAWVEVRALPGREGLGVYLLDVTARRQAQLAAEEAAARLGLLAAVTTALTDTLDAERAVARLAQLVVPALGDWCVVTLVDDDTAAGALSAGRSGRAVDLRRGLRDVGWWHRDAALRPLVEAYTACRIGDLGDGAHLLRALREARPLHLARATEEISAVLTPGGEAVALLRELAPASASVFPLRGRGRTVGLLTLFAGPDRVPLTDVEVATAGEVAARAGLALDSARLYRQQRDLAEGLQRSLLSEPPEPDHGQIVVRYVPAAEAAQVGG
ncbi:GAF domain-containing protein, partial [Kineococcus siccus]|uniref:GAF domain-containing protein n=1 Tax=Kineococcus siccus TaxID=2696567 RepID=UPI0030B84219